LVFPPEICSTDKRPDIIIWSQCRRMVLLIELTVPADENIVAAQIRKTARYQELSDLMKSVNNWNSKIITIEVGARGFVAKSMNFFLRSIGFSNKESSSICKSVSMIVARCSHHIFANRNNTSWRKGPLLIPYKTEESNNLKIEN
jgi:beta-lactamase class D